MLLPVINSPSMVESEVQFMTMSVGVVKALNRCNICVFYTGMCV